MTVGGKTVFPGQFEHLHVRFRSRAEGNHFERRGVCLEKLATRSQRVAVELVNDVDRLRGRAELLHERVIGRHVVRVHPGTMHEVVELDAEENLAVFAQLVPQLPGHGPEVLLFVQGLAEKLAQFGVDRLGIVVAQESEARIDFLLEEFAVHARETGQHLDEQGEKVRAFRHGARTAQGAPQQ